MATKTEEKEKRGMKPGGMTEEHKKALARGRRQSKAVRDYLGALEGERKVADEDRDWDAEISEIEQRIEEEEDPATRVKLIQDKLDLEGKRDSHADLDTMEDLEKSFKDIVKDYSERKGVTYKAWREAGVPAKVLKDAGLSRR